MDTVYPEPVSKIYHRLERRKGSGRLASRYRTMPVTFSEIQEVDEENIDEEEGTATKQSEERINVEGGASGGSGGVVSSRSDHDLKSIFSNHPTLNERSRRTKPTLKSINRKLLQVDIGSTKSKPTIEISPGSPESPDETSSTKTVSRMNLSLPRTSI